ncbi:hypothetical protein EH223_11175 [candidate division KSB1 bacterium]|nr:hypothetical protein [candidate division KSB1 bacterium]RQW03001.1 MAG: hypothetical protein EH223_11175 [candidate division KSB1 bacterium]
MVKKRLNELLFALTVVSLNFVTVACIGSEHDTSSTLYPPSLDLKKPPSEMLQLGEEKIKVFVGFFLFDIASINTAEQTFKADFSLRLQWHDSRLTLKSRNEKSMPAHYGLADIWHPDIRFLNSQKFEKLYDGFVEINDQGDVSTVQRYVGEFTTKFALKDFPIDTQMLSIILGTSGRYSSDDLEFVFDPSRSGTQEELTIADWSITSESAQNAPMTFFSIDTSRSVSLSSLSFLFKARRHAGYYTWKIVVPLTLIVLMAFAVFWIDPAKLGAQVTISTASVITVVAFQFSLGYLLPKISYLTRIDTFILGSTIFVFLALAESIVTSAVAAKKHAAVARKIDLWSRWLFSASFLLLFFISFVF